MSGPRPAARARASSGVPPVPAAPGRPAPARSVARALAALSLLTLALLAGCQRRTRFEPLKADSTAIVSVDSLVLLARDAQAQWDAPAGGEEAARLSARFVLNDLRVHARLDPTLSWEERVRTLLDSLGVGAELASAPCAIVVNFFARSDPEQGSWPWAFWCGEKALLGQALEGRGLKLVSVKARGVWGSPPAPPGPPGIAVIFARRGAGGAQPMLMAWDLGGGRANLLQTLGPDSLGGTGSGEFEAPDDTTIELVTRTFRATPRFAECPTCPHVYRLNRFRWGAQGFERVSLETVPSPYSTFVQFIQALTADDRAAAAALVTDPGLVEAARRLQWGVATGLWRVAPSTDETAHEMVFFRGQDEAYRVGFEPRVGQWLISGFRPTTQSVE